MDDEHQPQGEDDRMNLLDCLLVLLKRKRLILGVTVGVAILATVISLIIPNTYRGVTKILPPQQQSPSMASQILGQLTSATGPNLVNLGAAVGIKTPGELYIGMLKSRTVLDAIIDRFTLMESYRVNYREDARQALLEALTAQEDKKSGIITVGLEDKDPKKAAEMANAFVEELRRLSGGLAVTDAGQRRLFYEEQLRDAKESLVKSEESMKGFQEASGAVKMDDQAKAVIQSIAQARAQVAAREVQLKVMKTYMTPRNPDRQRLEEEIRGLNEQLGRLEAKGGQHPDPLMPTSRMPQVGMEYVRNMRELKFNEALYEILLKQFEAAKLDEAREATVIQVIEKAVPPEKKIRPKRTQMVMIAGIAGFFIAIFVAFFMEFIERSRSNPENRERLELLKQYAAIRRKR